MPKKARSVAKRMAAVELGFSRSKGDVEVVERRGVDFQLCYQAMLKRTCAVPDEVVGFEGGRVSVFIGQVVQLGYRMLTRHISLPTRLAARHSRAQRLELTHNNLVAVEGNARDDSVLSGDQPVLPVDDV